MKIDVIFNLSDKTEEIFLNKSVVVIDILRATSTIITAIANGAKNIIPVGTVEEAIKIAKNLERSTYLLCGERNTRMIDGFDLGNSPLEFTKEKVEGKKIILTTTNGTKIFQNLRFSKNVLVGSSLNVNALCNKMIELDSDWTLICSGRDGYFDQSDAICAGLIIYSIEELLNKEIELNDAGKVSKILYEISKENLQAALKETDHGKILINSNFEKDIEFISQLNLCNINAKFTNNIISILQ